MIDHVHGSILQTFYKGSSFLPESRSRSANIGQLPCPGCLPLMTNSFVGQPKLQKVQCTIAFEVDSYPGHIHPLFGSNPAVSLYALACMLEEDFVVIVKWISSMSTATRSEIIKLFVVREQERE